MHNLEKIIQSLEQELPKDCKLIAVSKYVDYQVIEKAYSQGIRNFGESRIQDAITKKQQLTHLEGITWHFVGHLQSNKIKEALQIFEWIHAVDSLKLAEQINKQAGLLKLKPKVLLQIKLAEDQNKFGLSIPELMSNLDELDKLEHLQIKGFMSILPKGLSKQENLQLFQKLKDLQTTLSIKNFTNIKIDELSMGMSNDYKEAIQAGSTMIRIGSLLFK